MKVTQIALYLAIAITSVLSAPLPQEELAPRSTIDAAPPAESPTFTFKFIPSTASDAPSSGIAADCFGGGCKGYPWRK
nr:uncharacterized protein CI109_005184 [Kwoniella shandongensis]KAA5526415.1 hypothetical protein CI109_005184 [Kwoniella shandongensis]